MRFSTIVALGAVAATTANAWRHCSGLPEKCFDSTTMLDDSCKWADFWMSCGNNWTQCCTDTYGDWKDASELQGLEMFKNIMLMSSTSPHTAPPKEETNNAYRDIGFGSVMFATGALITYGVMRYRD